MENKRKEVTGKIGQAYSREQIKQELSKSHFTLGNFAPTYCSESQKQYYDKTAFKIDNTRNANVIGPSLRKTNYNLGSDKPEYLSESALKYKLPLQSYLSSAAKDELRFNSQELQKSHHVFGKQDVPWITTTQSNFTQRDYSDLRYKIEKPKNALKFGNLKNDFISSNFDNYVPHNPKMNIINKQQAQELRKHHFIFGTETSNLMFSSHNLNYQKPRSTSNHLAPTVSNHLLRQSHFSLGQDRSINPSEHYTTTYMNSMKLK